MELRSNKLITEAQAFLPNSSILEKIHIWNCQKCASNLCKLKIKRWIEHRMFETRKLHVHTIYVTCDMCFLEMYNLLVKITHLKTSSKPKLLYFCYNL